ncbi:hypothetical protein D3C76_1693410 [compost metagenome]
MQPFDPGSPVGVRRAYNLEYAVRHPPKKPPLLWPDDLEPENELLLEELDPSPLDLPPIPPAFDEVERLTIDPVVEVDVFGRTTEPATCLFWNVSLE